MLSSKKEPDKLKVGAGSQHQSRIQKVSQNIGLKKENERVGTHGRQSEVRLPRVIGHLRGRLLQFIKQDFDAFEQQQQELRRKRLNDVHNQDNDLDSEVNKELEEEFKRHMREFEYSAEVALQKARAQKEEAQRAAEKSRQDAEEAARAQAERAAREAQEAARAQQEAAHAQQAKLQAEQAAALQQQRAKEAAAKVGGVVQEKGESSAGARSANSVHSTLTSLAEWRESCALQAVQYTNEMRQYKEGLSKAATQGLSKDIKELSKHLMQVSKTDASVRAKVGDILGVLGSRQGVECQLLLLQLAKKVVLQAEQNVTCIPLAMVVSNIVVKYPTLHMCIINNLHQICPITVPSVDLPPPPPGDPPMTTEAYIGRINGIVYFYGAFVALTNRTGQLGVQHAYRYVVRLITTIKPNRIPATALEQFLKISGFLIYQAYKRQAVKLFRYIQRVYLPKLAQVQDDAVEAVCSRLGQYLKDEGYREASQALVLSKFDESKYIEA